MYEKPGLAYTEVTVRSELMLRVSLPPTASRLMNIRLSMCRACLSRFRRRMLAVTSLRVSTGGDCESTLYRRTLTCRRGGSS